MKNAVKFLVGILIAVAVGFGLFWAYTNTGLLDWMKDEPDEYVFETSVLKEKISNIGELATVEYQYTIADSIDNQKIEWLGLTKKTVAMAIDGILKIGVDVNKIDIQCDELTKTITITLPAATQISNELFEDTMQILNEDSGLFNKIDLNDASELRQHIKDKAEAKAVEYGLFEKAKENAAQILTLMIEAMPDVTDNYSIVIK